MTLLQRTLSVTAAALATLLTAPAALAQAAPAGNVHGHVTNVAGLPLTKGEVDFTKDKTAPRKDQKFTKTVTLGSDGNYSATALTPGDYFVYVIADGKDVDRLELTLKAGDDKTLDFDMTREEYVKAMTPEQRKEVEDYKKKNAAAQDANKVIAGLNATLKQVRADLTAALPTKADVSTDVASMKAAVDAKPDEGLLWINYGDTLQAQGDHLAAEDKKAAKSALSDDAVTKMYSDAQDAYKKGIDLDAASKKPNPGNEASSYNQMGNSLAKSGKTPEASAAFESAVKLDPSRAGMYYKNEAAVLYNAQQTDGALAAADKAIAADPKGADPYYIKGQILIAKSTFDNKTQKLTAPPGCVEAYDKFLELAPNDPKAPAVQEVLTSLGEKINTKYKAGKK